LEPGKLVLITPTEYVKDRLAWYYHAGDQQSLLQAILVTGDQSIKIDEIMKWSEREGKLEEIEEFRAKLLGCLLNNHKLERAPFYASSTKHRGE
jgi:hypothetical protein